MDKINSRVSLPIWLLALSALVLLGILGATGVVASGAFSKVASASPTLYDEQVVVALFERADPAVVEIEVTQSNTNHFGFVIPQSGQGSGFLMDTEGHILTNYHVVQGATGIRVTLADGRTLEAQIAGTSPADDIALLKVDPQAVDGIVPLPLGDSSTIKPGQMAIALGSPFGLENTITVGVVSGVDRSHTGILRRPIVGMIQTDASINPGNSGGPLLNSLGEVMGINTSIETSAGSATGIGFAVPINTAKDLLAQLMENATVRRPWLGISGMALSPALGDMLQLGTSKGVYVTEVMQDSPAQGAGLRGGGTGADGTPTGDIITAVDGQEVESVEELVSYFNTLQPGDTVVLTVTRSGQTLQVTVVLGEWPDSFEISPG
ncbi:MAG: trypsin-like peptidase domain-containing protein [Chloroflexota bacterium]